MKTVLGDLSINWLTGQREYMAANVPSIRNPDWSEFLPSLQSAPCHVYEKLSVSRKVEKERVGKWTTPPTFQAAQACQFLYNKAFL